MTISLLTKKYEISKTIFSFSLSTQKLYIQKVYRYLHNLDIQIVQSE